MLSIPRAIISHRISLILMSLVLLSYEANSASADSLAARDALDRTVWSKEVRAQQHERVFTRFWDQLREADNKLLALSKLSFSSLKLPTHSDFERLANGIKQWTWHRDHQTLAPELLNTRLAKLSSSGIVLESTEWHHQAFDEATPSRAAQSQVSFVLNLSSDRSPTRYSVSGILRIVWQRKGNQDAPSIDEIHAENVTLMEREMTSGFAKVASMDARALGDPPHRIHPLILHDLNGDGLSEVILGGVNTVHWNLGNGRFRRAPLIQQWRGEIGESAIIADFTGDRIPDFLCITVKDRVPVLFQGAKGGIFALPGRPLSGFPIQNASVMTTGDIDGDNDLDIYVTQYRRAYTGGQMPTPFYDANDGYPAYLLINEGTGKFTDGTQEAGLAPKRFRRTYSASFTDLDQDHDLDLLVISDFAGADYYLNNGRGIFEDVRDQQIDQWHNFGMAHAIADFNLDEKLDFYVIGMSSTTMRRLNYMDLNRPGFSQHGTMRTVMGYGNRLYLNRGDHFEAPPYADTAARTGWSWGTSAFDFDNDGDQDLYVANGFISGDSTQDYCTTFWCHDIYTGDSNPNPKIAAILNTSQLPIMNRQISWNGYEHNQLLLNQREAGFRNVSHLFGTALNQDCRAVATDDLNGDGRVDLLVVEERWEGQGNKAQILHVMANATDTPHNWIGLRLNEADAKQPIIGATVRVVTASGTQLRQFVTGDSFFTQHANTAHFGLGTDDQVESMTIQWLTGETTQVSVESVNRYYSLP